jgi:predicted transcriptional regulator
MTSHHTSFCINKSSEKMGISPSALAKIYERVLKIHGLCLKLLPCEDHASNNTIPTQYLHQESNIIQ